MNYKLLFVIFTSLIGYALISSAGGRATTQMDGNTGAPLESGITCITCHNTGPFGTVDAFLTVLGPSGLPATTYDPGTTYNLTFQVSDTSGLASRFGFQMTALDPNNSAAGTFQNPGLGTGLGVAFGRTYWEHTGPSFLPLFTADWTAPFPGKGDITFYYTATAVNNDNTTLGDNASASKSFVLPEAAGCPPISVIAIEVSPVSCAGGCDGSAVAQTSGGAFPYTYLWDDGSTAPLALNLCRGNHVVTITDSNGCKGTATVIINEPLPLTAQNSVMNVTCNGACDGQITTVAAGGTPPYTYIYNPINPGCAGNYTVTVVDALGCTTTSSAIITEPPAITLTITTTPVSSPSAADGTGTTNTGGGTPGYTYQWDNGEIGATATGLTAGIHCVTATDTNGCSEVACAMVGGGTSNTTTITGLEAISLYPNPADEQATLELSFNESVDLQLELTNTLGQSVLRLERSDVLEISETLDLSGVAAGVYLLGIRVDDQVLTKRLIVE